MSAATKCYRYLRRMVKFDQMDFEFAFWQMLYLFISPQKVYRNFNYRKHTKAQFARDDPAFLVLIIIWLCFTSAVFSIVLWLEFYQFLYLILHQVFISCIGAGIIAATISWFIANRFMRRKPYVQDVEWGYAFDVHLNAYFASLFILQVSQFICVIFINVESSQSLVLMNVISCIVVWYYLYVTFLGYSSLDFMHRTYYILFAIIIHVFLHIICLINSINVPYSILMFSIYKDST